MSDEFLTDLDSDDEVTGPLTTQSGEEYNTRGETVIRTRAGHVFMPSNKDLPPITPDGVAMGKDTAESVMEEANKAFGDGYVSKVQVDTEDDA